MIFNGYNLKDYVNIRDIRRGGILPPRSIETYEVKNRPGAIKGSHKWEAREIKVTFQIIGRKTATASRMENVRDVAEVVADILNTNEAVPIIFPDEPDRTYYGMLAGSSEMAEMSAIGEAEITIICFDPYKYGAEESVETLGGEMTILNTTNADIYPRYTITVNKKSSFLSIMDEDKHITIGDPGDIDTSPVDKEELILNDTMGNVTGWSNSQIVQEAFVNMGSIVADNGTFKPSSFGTDPVAAETKWRGPALSKQLTSELQDFKADIDLYNRPRAGTEAEKARRLGRVTLWFLDINNQVIAKVHVMDATNSLRWVKGHMYLGAEGVGRSILSHYDPYYKDFIGFMTVRREGKKWTVTVGLKDSRGIMSRRRTATYIDTAGTFNQKVAKVQVGILKYQNYDHTEMGIQSLKVYKLNNTPAASVPNVVDPGDIIDIDTATGMIYKNGDPSIMRYMDKTSDLFPIKPGARILGIMPSDIGTTVATYNKRWL